MKNVVPILHPVGLGHIHIKLFLHTVIEIKAQYFKVCLFEKKNIEERDGYSGLVHHGFLIYAQKLVFLLYTSCLKNK